MNNEASVKGTLTNQTSDWMDLACELYFDDSWLVGKKIEMCPSISEFWYH